MERRHIQCEIRRPKPGEFAVTFKEGGFIHVIPGAVICMLPNGLIYDSILGRLIDNPWDFTETGWRHYWKGRLALFLLKQVERLIDADTTKEMDT